MKPIVSVNEVVGVLGLLNSENKAFLNTQTGEPIILSLEEISQAEDGLDSEDMPDWQQEVIQEAKEVIGSDDYIELPTAYDIHEYRIMQDFCYSAEDDETCERLLRSISGIGALRSFKDTIHRLNIEDDWYRLCGEAFERIAVVWLEKNGIEYTNTGRQE